MVLKTQSAKTPVAGPSTTVVRKLLQEHLRSAAQVLRPAPPCHPRGLSMAPVCPIKPRHFVAGPTPNETDGTHCRYKQCVFSYASVPSVPLPDTISAHAVVPTETKPGHQVSPHRPPSYRPPSILMPHQSDPLRMLQGPVAKPTPICARRRLPAVLLAVEGGRSGSCARQSDTRFLRKP